MTDIIKIRERTNKLETENSKTLKQHEWLLKVPVFSKKT